MSEAAAMFDLSGRTALVTGAGSGLGRAFAKALAQAGAHALCADVDEQSAVSAAREIADAGGQASAHYVNVAEEDSVAALAAEVRKAHDGLDVLINNAGIATPPARLPDVSVSDWDRAIAINLRGPFLVTRAMIPLLLARQRSSVIHLSSILGLVGAYPDFPITAVPYAATKAAIIGFSRQLAIEYAREGLRSNAIAPGWHGGTNLGRERRATTTPEEMARFENYISGTIPMGHRGTPADLVGLVLYLASDASSYMTGQVFAHDGGWTAA